MGQKALTDWPGKTKTADEMIARIRGELACPPEPLDAGGRSRWGGNTAGRVNEGSGYFSLSKYRDRYVLVDPDGYEFFSTGLDCVGVDGDCNLEGIYNLAGGFPTAPSAGSAAGGANIISAGTPTIYRAFGKDVNSWRC